MKEEQIPRFTLKITPGQLKAFSLKTQDAARETLGGRGILLDSESISPGTFLPVRGKLGIIHIRYEFDLIVDTSVLSVEE